MDLTWSSADVAFRDEVREFLDDKLTPELRRAGRSDLAELERRVRARILADHGVELHDLCLVNPHVLPKTRNGKIERVACRTAYLSNQLPNVTVEVTEALADEQI